MKRLILGIAVGAGAMYLLDPEKGPERRSRLLGFYGENKDTFQDYAQTAAQTAVTVSQTVGDVASTVAGKASEITGKSETADDEVAAAMINGTAGNGKAAEPGRGGRTSTPKQSAAPPTDDPAPGLGGSGSS